ncbi:baculoviral IAP repeat-containing protein 7-B-like [Mercenaria mercenaria]|uniref:baculoviral IAP repeat-containing protein 7-B-like n=1 Tax=Mercenaria mercenaria TaxID=6596 RepID=UPI00234E48D8|nr:baculoviral IAP repeat-containing protein 7-B-like [Mercenaria mercenaria]
MPKEDTNTVDAEGTDYVDFDKKDCDEDDYTQQLRLKREQARLDTYKDWPRSLPVRPEDLARDGFYYLKTGDRVKCIFCNLVLKSWEEGDIVRNEHRKFNSCCPFLLNKNCGNVPLQNSQPAVSSGAGLVPRFPEYSKPAAREGTFRNKPQSMRQSVDELVEAGFFYTGHDDCVRCFHCGILIRNWEPEDDPWSEHRQWSPTCPFLKSKPESTESFEMTPVIKRVLNMGYDKELVKAVVQRNKRSGGAEITDLNELVDAVEKLRLQQETVSRAHGITKETGASGTSQITENSFPTAGASSIEDEYKLMKDQRLCKICMEREVEITFTPCGHLVACEQCAQPLKRCPICRKLIRSCVKTYLS